MTPLPDDGRNTVDVARGSASELAERLREILGQFHRQVRRNQSGLPLTQLTVLAATERGVMNLTDLAGLIHVRPSTMTVVVDRLQERGLVKRTPDEIDRRVVRIQITPTGRSILLDERRRSDTYLTSLIEVLSDEDQKTLEDAADVLKIMLGQSPESA